MSRITVVGSNIMDRNACYAFTLACALAALGVERTSRRPGRLPQVAT